jgi:hypothetical protein
MASKVTLSKAPVDGKRPGDMFTRLGVPYRVVQVRPFGTSGAFPPVYVTESRYGREVWF